MHAMKIKYLSGIAILLLISGFLSCKAQEKEPPAEKVEEKTQPPVFQSSFLNYSKWGVPTDEIIELSYAGQVAHWVRAIGEDSNGHIWMGTNHYGLIRHNGDTLEYFSEETGVGNNRINQIIRDGDVLWVATAGGLTKYEDQTFTNYTTKDGLLDDGVYGMLLDSKGRLWLGTLQGVSYLEDGVFKTFEVPKPNVDKPDASLSEDGVLNIFEDKEGNYWFAFDGQGFTIYDGAEFSFLTAADGLQDNKAGGLFQDKDGNIWISSMLGGISRYDGESFEYFTKDGLVEGVETSGVYEDSKGDLWFAAEHVGVYRYDGSSFELFNEEDGLLSQGVITFHEDSKGRFWVGGFKGLFRFDRQAYAQGKKSFTAVTQEDGPWN